MGAMEIVGMRRIRQAGGVAIGHGGFSRRGFVGLCGAGLCGAGVLALPLLPGSARAAAVPADRRFAIFREGAEIGRHEVSFAYAADGLSVTTEIDIAIKVLFVTAFAFRLSALERWQDGQLVESRIETNDDGSHSKTVIQESGGLLTVEGGVDGRAVEVPLGMMTDIAFWNAAIVHQRALIDPQKVEVNEVAAHLRGEEMVEVAGGTITAERYAVTSSKSRNGDIWFDADGNWVKGVMTTRGETLDYRLIA